MFARRTEYTIHAAPSAIQKFAACNFRPFDWLCLFCPFAYFVTHHLIKENSSVELSAGPVPLFRATTATTTTATEKENYFQHRFLTKWLEILVYSRRYRMLYGFRNIPFRGPLIPAWWDDLLDFLFIKFAVVAAAAARRAAIVNCLFTWEELAIVAGLLFLPNGSQCKMCMNENALQTTTLRSICVLKHWASIQYNHDRIISIYMNFFVYFYFYLFGWRLWRARAIRQFYFNIFRKC